MLILMYTYGGLMKGKKILRNVTGCLLGGAVGDALGRPVEFDDYSAIESKYGPDGIKNLETGNTGFFEITDDTQMTLFTAEGLLRALTTARDSRGEPDYFNALRCSYLSWLKTQCLWYIDPEYALHTDGWLVNIEGLHRQRAAGRTCLSALCEDTFRENNIANNYSKGCGGVMRAAPAGLLAARIKPDDCVTAAKLAFNIGCTAAAVTHGHPSGYYSAGVLASIIATIISGGTIEDGIRISLGFLDGCSDADETREAVQAAVDLWLNTSVAPSHKTVESLGGGWFADEAIAISLYCALVAGNDFTRGVRLAVNHSGDSDSTGSITRNLLGAKLGERAIPRYWLKGLELVDVIRQVGRDLNTTFENTETWLKSYPLVPCSAISSFLEDAWLIT